MKIIMTILTSFFLFVPAFAAPIPNVNDLESILNDKVGKDFVDHNNWTKKIIIIEAAKLFIKNDFNCYKERIIRKEIVLPIQIFDVSKIDLGSYELAEKTCEWANSENGVYGEVHDDNTMSPDIPSSRERCTLETLNRSLFQSEKINITDVKYLLGDELIKSGLHFAINRVDNQTVYDGFVVYNYELRIKNPYSPINSRIYGPLNEAPEFLQTFIKKREKALDQAAEILHARILSAIDKGLSEILNGHSISVDLPEILADNYFIQTLDPRFLKIKENLTNEGYIFSAKGKILSLTIIKNI